MPLTSTETSRNSRKRKKAMGYIQKTVWIKPRYEPLLKFVAECCRDEYTIHHYHADKMGVSIERDREEYMINKILK